MIIQITVYLKSTREAGTYQGGIRLKVPSKELCVECEIKEVRLRSSSSRVLIVKEDKTIVNFLGRYKLSRLSPLQRFLVTLALNEASKVSSRYPPFHATLGKQTEVKKAKAQYEVSFEGESKKFLDFCRELEDC